MGIIEDNFKDSKPEVSEDTNAPIESGERRITGKIIKVASDEGWGFISSKDIPFTRIFFHWSSLRQDTLRFPDLKTGMKVEFTPKEHETKGWRATKIIVV
jgi:cold shock CspA family protein